MVLEHMILIPQIKFNFIRELVYQSKFLLVLGIYGRKEGNSRMKRTSKLFIEVLWQSCFCRMARKNPVERRMLVGLPT
jgi:hypothetical protein